MTGSDVIAVLGRAGGWSRVVALAVVMVPLVLATLAVLPALAVLPFFAAAEHRTSRLLRLLADWSAAAANVVRG